MAFLVEIGLNNPSSGASTYDVYISDFTNTYPYTGWIQVVAGIDYNQFPVIVNTDDYPEVNDNIKYKIVSNNGCECEGCPGEQISLKYAWMDENDTTFSFTTENYTYSDMYNIICNFQQQTNALYGSGGYKIQKHGSNIAVGDTIITGIQGSDCNGSSNRIFYYNTGSGGTDPGWYIVTGDHGIITQFDYINCNDPV